MWLPCDSVSSNCPLRNLDPLKSGGGNRLGDMKSLAWVTQPGRSGAGVHIVFELGSEAKSDSVPP